MKNPNAILVFARTAGVSRSNGNGPFASLPWDELDSILHACVWDTLQAASSVPDTDVILYRSPQFPVEKLPPAGQAGPRRIDMAPGDGGEEIRQAVENAFLEFYHRVIIVLENNPLIGPEIMRAAMDQLGMEDDCAVFTPAGEREVALLGVKSNYPRLFAGTGGDTGVRPADILDRLCELDVLLVPTRPSFLVDSSANIERLRAELEGRDPEGADFPKRTWAMFRSLERKYRWKRGVR